MLRKGLGHVVQNDDPSLMKTLEVIGLGNNDQAIYAATCCFSSFVALLELVLSANAARPSFLYDHQLNDFHSSLASAVSRLPSLQTLSIRYCHISLNGLITLISHWVYLRTLDLSSCHFSSTVFRGYAANQISNLEALQLVSVFLVMLGYLRWLLFSNIYPVYNYSIAVVTLSCCLMALFIMLISVRILV